MGKVAVKAKIENLGDLYLSNRGHLGSAAVREVEMADALVDTGATMLSMPKRLIERRRSRRRFP
jgi:hypothetical protein